MSIVLAVLALGAAYGLAGLWLPAAAILILGADWLIVRRVDRFRHPDRMAWVMMGLFAIAAAVGAWLGTSPLLLTIGMTAALSAWDMDHFARQLGDVDLVVRQRKLARRHLRRLLVVDGIALLFAVLALEVQIRLGFGLALVLGLVALLGLGRIVGFLGEETSS